MKNNSKTLAQQTVKSILENADSAKIPATIAETREFFKSLTKKAHYTTKTGLKKYVLFIDYTAQPEARRDYLYFVQAVKTVSLSILSKHSAMHMNGYNIEKFDTALKICNYVYFRLCQDFENTALQGKSRYYEKRDRMNLTISKVFDIFSTADGMLIDLLEIALQYIPFNPAQPLDIAKGTKRAKKAIDKHLEISKKELRDSISIDNSPKTEDAQNTVKELSKIAFTKWTYQQNAEFVYDSDNKTVTALISDFYDSLTARQLEVLTTYAAVGSLEKTGKMLGIKSKGAVADSLKKARARFLAMIDSQTKIYLQEQFRLLKYKQVTEPETVAKLKKYYNIQRKTNGDKYLTIPYTTYLFNDMEYPHSYGYVVKKQKHNAGWAWYDHTQPRQYEKPIYKERIYPDFDFSLWQKVQTKIGKVLMCTFILHA